MKNYVGIETSQRHTEQIPAELPKKAVRTVRIGTSAHLLQLGLRGEVVECLCYFRNVRDKLADRKSTYTRTFGTPCDVPVILFGTDFSM